MSKTRGKVTVATISLYKGLTWTPETPAKSDGAGHLKKFDNNHWNHTAPGIGGNGEWGALPFFSSPPSLLMTQATFEAVSNGTPIADGYFVDMSDSLGGGVVVYALFAETGTKRCFAELYTPPTP